MIAGRLILVMVAATTVTTVSTQPTACIPAGPAKAGWVSYTAQGGETPYSLAERFYGKMWMGYQIADANRLALTKEGYFPKGARLMIPPGLNGLPVDVTRWNDHPRVERERDR